MSRRIRKFVANRRFTDCVRLTRPKSAAFSKTPRVPVTRSPRFRFLESRALIDDEEVGTNLLSQKDCIPLAGAKVCEVPAKFPNGNPKVDPIRRLCRPLPDDVGAFHVVQFNNDRLGYDDSPIEVLKEFDSVNL
jgi:hypothetical protein